MADTDSLDNVEDCDAGSTGQLCECHDSFTDLISYARSLESQLADTRESRERLRKWLSQCGKEADGYLAELRGLRSQLAESQRENAAMHQALPSLLHCHQCGQKVADTACGPTHALLKRRPQDHNEIARFDAETEEYLHEWRSS